MRVLSGFTHALLCQGSSADDEEEIPIGHSATVTTSGSGSTDDNDAVLPGSFTAINQVKSRCADFCM